MKLIAPSKCLLWCHRCHDELWHSAGRCSYVCSNCGNHKHLAEVVAIYSVDDLSSPAELLLPERLLPADERAFRYRQVWLNATESDSSREREELRKMQAGEPTY